MALDQLLKKRLLHVDRSFYFVARTRSSIPAGRAPAGMCAPSVSICKHRLFHTAGRKWLFGLTCPGRAVENNRTQRPNTNLFLVNSPPMVINFPLPGPAVSANKRETCWAHLKRRGEVYKSQVDLMSLVVLSSPLSRGISLRPGQMCLSSGCICVDRLGKYALEIERASDGGHSGRLILLPYNNPVQLLFFFFPSILNT